MYQRLSYFTNSIVQSSLYVVMLYNVTCYEVELQMDLAMMSKLNLLINTHALHRIQIFVEPLSITNVYANWMSTLII